MTKVECTDIYGKVHRFKSTKEALDYAKKHPKLFGYSKILEEKAHVYHANWR
jgi:hypothetical protein